MTRALSCLVALLWALPADRSLAAQTRSMSQDSSLDNLRHPSGYRTAEPATLGGVIEVGSGRRSMILVPGLGFGGDVFGDFMARRATDYRMFAVTLPGFGGTPALPMPDSGGSFGDLPWTRSAERAIMALMDRERIGRATLVAHWALATQIVLRLAVEHPDRFDAVVILAGPARAYYSQTPAMLNWTAAERAKFADAMGARWFRTVTRRTWDDNNFMSYDYAVNPRRGLFLWRKAAEPTLPVWIRYLLEFYSIDLIPDLPRLRVPTLVVKPGLDDPASYVEDSRTYLRDLTHDSWRGVDRLNAPIEFATIAGSRLFIMYDQPAELDRVVEAFLARITAR